MKRPEKIVILGSTGSIGQSTLTVVRESAGKFEVVGLAAGRASDELQRQIDEFKPQVVAVRSNDAYDRLVRLNRSKPHAPRMMHGQEGLERLAALPGAAKIVNALSGGAGIRPSLSALNAGKSLLLANKEALVAAGEIIMKSAKANKTTILPVDSEHSAIFQCLRGESKKSVRKLYITASGGPFLNRKTTKGITAQMALRHPKWKMGPKVTVDSATLMNKGLEVIEAMWLFDVPLERIRVLVHPECVIHSMVEFCDGVTIAQLSAADMKIPIRYALNYPHRAAVENVQAPDFAGIGKLTFFEPDLRRFPCLELARAAADEKGLLPAMLSAADEVAVEAFLKGRIGFGSIPLVIEYVLDKGRASGAAKEKVTLEAVLAADSEARSMAREYIKRQ
ncbi:MAG: 1-deoxy-D-xylulose-5-phosphate reductoisomerase [bacterium]